MTLDPLARPKLEAAYRLTNYVVDDRGVNFTIRLDGDNVALREFLAGNNAPMWTFLTAYNPFSQTLPDEENNARQSRLMSALYLRDYEYYEGRGIGDDREEPSLFVINVGREEAIGLGRQFDQNAILWGESNGKAELIWCVD
ncbi:MAG: DUF3293 domain-containing protein [Pyrinomonadaceae bacterium]